MRIDPIRLWLCFGLAAPVFAQDADGDSDGDGIPDSKDLCPTEAEDKNGFQDDDGCKDERVRKLSMQPTSTQPAPAAAPATAPPSPTQTCLGVVTDFGPTSSSINVQCDDGRKVSAYTGQGHQPSAVGLGSRGTLTCTTEPASSLCNFKHFVDTAGVTQEAEGDCFLTTAVTRARGEADDGPTLTAFRAFRDGPLAGHPDVEAYRRLAPGIVRFISSRPEAGLVWRVVDEDYLQPILAAIRARRNAEAHAGYRALVRDLQVLTERLAVAG